MNRTNAPGPQSEMNFQRFQGQGQNQRQQDPAPENCFSSAFCHLRHSRPEQPRAGIKPSLRNVVQTFLNKKRRPKTQEPNDLLWLMREQIADRRDVRLVMQGGQVTVVPVTRAEKKDRAIKNGQAVKYFGRGPTKDGKKTLFEKIAHIELNQSALATIQRQQLLGSKSPRDLLRIVEGSLIGSAEAVVDYLGEYLAIYPRLKYDHTICEAIFSRAFNAVRRNLCSDDRWRTLIKLTRCAGDLYLISDEKRLELKWFKRFLREVERFPDCEHWATGHVALSTLILLLRHEDRATARAAVKESVVRKSKWAEERKMDIQRILTESQSAIELLESAVAARSIQIPEVETDAKLDVAFREIGVLPSREQRSFVLMALTKTFIRLVKERRMNLTAVSKAYTILLREAKRLPAYDQAHFLTLFTTNALADTHRLTREELQYIYNETFSMIENLVDTHSASAAKALITLTGPLRFYDSQARRQRWFAVTNKLPAPFKRSTMDAFGANINPQ